MNHTQIQSLIDKRRQEGRQLINLATGGLLLPPSDDVLKMIKNVQLSQFNYTSSIGSQALRENMATHFNETYSSTLDAKNMAFVAGGTEGVYLSIAAFENTDQWLHHMPGWHTLKTMLIMLKRHFLTCSGPEFSADLVKTIRRDSPFGIYINTPVNPTGFIHPYDALVSLLQLDDHPIVLDMVYEGMTNHPMPDYFDGLLQHALSQLHHCTLVFSFSKLFRLPGLRLGLVVGEKHLIQKIADLKSATTLNMPLDLQALIPTLWKQRHHEMTAVSNFLRQRSAWLTALAQQQRLPILPSDATHYRLIDAGEHALRWFDELVEHDIFLAKCTHNGMNSCLRFNMSADLPSLEVFFNTLAQFQRRH